MHIDSGDVVASITHALIGLLIFVSGAALSAVNIALQSADELSFITKNILGPTGLLVGSLATVRFLVRYLRDKEKRIQALEEERARVLRERIEKQEETIEKLLMNNRSD